VALDFPYLPGESPTVLHSSVKVNNCPESDISQVSLGLLESSDGNFVFGIVSLQCIHRDLACCNDGNTYSTIAADRVHLRFLRDTVVLLISWLCGAEFPFSAPRPLRLA
jgi:hypothetical protein